ncbi:MAG: hypothetical protein HYU37_07060 [Acidobacteria bacterium]|nr:hypothetical protein [Acidobacteriota bacterium]
MLRPRPIVLVVLFLTFLAGAADAATWYVKADAAPGGDGSRNRPFATLEQVEKASQPGDTIRVLPSTRPLDGGIQLKDNQRLVGDGDAVTKAPAGGARPTITNTTSARYQGDGIRLATNTVVENIHVDRASRAGIFGVNASRAQIRNNLITNNMIQGNDLRRLEQPWPKGFILYESQTNHFGGITLLACGPAASSYCTMHAPERPAAPTTGEMVIAGNVIRDSNLEGVMLITDTGVAATFTVNDTVVRDLSQGLPDPLALTPPADIVRSRAFTHIGLNRSRTDLAINRLHAENVAPPGRYAADGLVLLTGGDSPVVNAKVSQFTMLNPKMTGEINNGDSIEIQHRGSTNAVLNVDMSRLDLRDPASANIKILEASNPTGGSYNLTVSDSVLTNHNPAGGVDGQIRLSGASNGTKAFTLVVRNTRFEGIGGAIGILNPNNIETLTVMVENSSMSGFMQPPGAKPIAAVTWTHPADKTIGKAILDLGGGPLGSRGRNRFVNNPWLDVQVTNANAKTVVQVDASNNYWGGGAPAVTEAPPGDVVVSGGVKFNAPAHLTADPAR